jgi:hypothetical protein
MLLAWFGYLWPLVLLAAMRSAPRSSSRAGPSGRADLGRIAGIALFLALGLAPDRLLHPVAAAGRFIGEWRREGGFTGPGGAGWLSLLSLAVAFGPLAWAGWPVAAWRGRRDGVRCLVPAGGVLLCLGLPVLLGVRQPGAVQWSVVPLLAAWGVGGVVSLFSPRRGLAGIGVVVGLALVVTPIPRRLAWHRGAASEVQSLAAVRAEIGTFVGKGELVVAEADPSVPAATASTAAATDSSGASIGF